MTSDPTVEYTINEETEVCVEKQQDYENKNNSGEENNNSDESTRVDFWSSWNLL